MLTFLRRYLSTDDLWSVLGYALLLILIRLSNRTIEFPMASAFVAGMLGVFWLASKNVRARNADRQPNARVIFWAAVAAVSALFAVI